MSSLIPALVMVASLMCLGACQATAGTGSLDLSNPSTRARVTTALAVAVKRGRVELGASGADRTSVVTVLPPPLGPHETHALALPVTFDIKNDKGRCYAVRRDTQESFELMGVDCALNP